MLDSVADLAQHSLRHVGRILRYEPHGNAFGTDETDNLLHLVEERLRRVVEQKMRLVEEEGDLGPVEISRLRKEFVEL